jgi:2-keto-4-pentenoate hydratase
MRAVENRPGVRACKAAELLLWARRNQTRLRELPSDLAPRDLNEAYEIQAAAALMRGSSNAGFKLGLTNEDAQRAADTFAPIVGRLDPADIRGNHSKIALPETHLRIVEAEVVFEIGADLPAAHAPYSQQRVMTNVSRAFAGIELCDSRFATSVDPSLACVVADNSNADLLVVGDELSAEDLSVFASPSIADLPVTLQPRGKPDVIGSTRKVLGNPLRALTWLANWSARHGVGLKRGQLISSGSCTGMTELACDGAVTATFGSGARVCVEFALDNCKNEVRE